MCAACFVKGGATTNRIQARICEPDTNPSMVRVSAHAKFKSRAQSAYIGRTQIIAALPRTVIRHPLLVDLRASQLDEFCVLVIVCSDARIELLRCRAQRVERLTGEELADLRRL